MACSGAHDAGGKALVVEVLHDVAEAFILLSDQVGLGDADVLEAKVSSISCPPALSRDLSLLEPLAICLNQQQRDTTEAFLLRIGADCDGKVLRGHTASDELLLAVDDVVVTVGDGGAADVLHVATTPRLSYTQSDDGLAGNDFWCHALFHFL